MTCEKFNNSVLDVMALAASFCQSRAALYNFSLYTHVDKSRNMLTYTTYHALYEKEPFAILCIINHKHIHVLEVTDFYFFSDRVLMCRVGGTLLATKEC